MSSQAMLIVYGSLWFLYRFLFDNFCFDCYLSAELYVGFVLIVKSYVTERTSYIKLVVKNDKDKLRSNHI